MIPLESSYLFASLFLHKMGIQTLNFKVKGLMRNPLCHLHDQ